MVLVMPEEVEFQQRWEYRRKDNDFDSSCDDSKSTQEPLGQKRKLVSADDDDETSKLKQKDNGNPGNGIKINNGKAKKEKTRNPSKKSESSKRRKKTPAGPGPEEVDLEKGATTTYDPSDDVKKFMALLLEDLKVTRESLMKQMMEEMQKLLAENMIPVARRKNHGHGGGKAQLQQKNKSKMDQEKQNVNRQHENDFENRSTTQNCNNRSSTGFPAAAADPTHYFNALGYRGEFGQVPEFIASSQKTKGESLSTSAKTNLQTSLADQNAQVQGRHKSVVLAIEAQNSNGRRSCTRTVKGKTSFDRSNHFQAPKDHRGGHGQAIEKLGLSGQTASSMYLTLPTVLTQSTVPNQGLDASLFNYVPPSISDNNRGLNQMLETSCDQASFPVMQTEERNNIFALMGSRNVNYINQNSTPTSVIGTGFTDQGLTLHHDQGLSIPRQVNPECFSHEHNKLPSFRMNGGAVVRFPGGGYNISEHFAVNNHHGCPAYTSDSRFMPYQIQNHKDDSHLFFQ